MKILIPASAGAVVISASSAPLSDYAAWATGTNYAAGARVHRASGGLTYDYEAIAPGSGVDPATDSQLANPTRWVRIGLSNRFKVVDRIISDPAKSTTGTLAYAFTMTETITSVAIFGMVGRQVAVSVSSGGVLIPGSQQAKMIADSPNISNWFEYFFDPFDISPDVIFNNLPGYAGNVLHVQLTAASDVEIGEIVFGREVEIGTTQENASIGIRDYSRKERDDFGRPLIVERPFSLYGEFDLVYPTSRTRSIVNQLSAIRASPAVFWAEGAEPGVEVLIFGYYSAFDLNLTVSADSYATLTVEGLV